MHRSHRREAGVSRSREPKAWAALGLTLCVLLSLKAQASALGPAPWSLDQELSEGWIVTSLKRHPEFLRLGLVRDKQRAQVEIVGSEDAEDAWSTRFYRVQPAPGLDAPKDALISVLKTLKRLESEPEHRPFVKQKGHVQVELNTPEARGPPLGELRTQTQRAWPPDNAWFWLLSNLLALALLGTCLTSHAEAKGLRLWFSLSLAAPVILSLSLDVSLLPLAWITLLQEGSVSGIIASLHGQGHHGPAFDALLWALGGEEGLRIRHIVKMNLVLGLFNMLGVAALTWVTTRRFALALLSASAWGLSPLVVNAAWSDLPAMLIASYTLLGACALSLFRHAPKRALTLLALIALLLGGVRLEWGILGAISWISLLGARLIPPSIRTHLDRGVTSLFALLIGLGSISLIGVLGEGTSASAPEAWQLWQAQGGGAADWGILTWPLAMAAACPLGLVILALIGGIQTLMRPLQWSAVFIGALLLQGIYWTSAHGGDAPYEVLRYATLMSGLLAALSALGWHVLLAWLDGRKYANTLVIGLALLCVIPPSPELFRSALETHHQESAGPLYEMPLSRHLQAEARSLIAAHERYPECIIASISAIEPSAEREVSAYEYVFFGGSLAAPLVTKRQPEYFNEGLDRVVSGSECVLVHRGLDCHIKGGPDCREEVGGAHFVSGLERLPRPYYDHVFRREPVRLELWQKRGMRRDDTR